MEDNVDDNKIIDSSSQFLEFRYNFINTPWDDRSNKSKASVIVLLVSIFVVTMALVINSFIMHYSGFIAVRKYNNSELSCFRVKMDDYKFVARIHSATTQQLLCVAAVVSSTSVLANGVCVKSGPVRMYLGSIANPRCKKGFSVDVTESIPHDGVVSKRLVLLSSYENIEGCSEVIQIGKKLDWSAKVHILGRPTSVGRSLSRQHVSLTDKDGSTSQMKNVKSNSNSSICVKDVARCPVRTGDLMMQYGKLFGLAATSAQRFKVACFADLSIVKRELKELDSDIEVDLQ